MRTEVLNSRASLTAHFTLLGFVPLKATAIKEETLAVGAADSYERTVMHYRSPGTRTTSRIAQRNENWAEVSWHQLTDNELRSTYRLLDARGWLS